MYDTLKKNAISGVTWTTFEYVIYLVIQIVQLSLLARILTPKDFGIFAIGTFFTTLGNTVFAMGLGPALIQKDGDVEKYLDTAWSANLLASIIATAILFLLAPVIICFYFQESEALYPALALISVVLISGLNNIGIVLYLKKIEMKRIFFYHVIPKVTGVFTAISFSLYFRNYWGLVIGIIAEFLLRMMLSYIFVPRRPRFVVDWLKLKELYSFGGWLQLKNIFSWAVNNIDVAIVGAVLNASLLGFYNRAMTLARLPQSQVTKIVNTISFPLYSAIRKNDTKLQNAVQYNNDLVLIILIPILIITLMFGEETVKLILGNDWLYLTQAFQLLILAIAVQSYLISFTPLLRALGFPKYEFVYQVIKIILMLILLYPLTKKFGIEGAGWAILVSTLVSAPYMFYKIKISIKLKASIWLSSLLVSLLGLFLIWLLKTVFITSPINNLEFIAIAFVSISIHFFILILFYLIFKLGPITSVRKSLSIINHRFPVKID